MSSSRFPSRIFSSRSKYHFGKGRGILLELSRRVGFVRKVGNCNYHHCAVPVSASSRQQICYKMPSLTSIQWHRRPRGASGWNFYDHQQIMLFSDSYRRENKNTQYPPFSDPSQLPPSSMAIFKQNDSDLSMEELELKRSLNEYHQQMVQWKQQRGNLDANGGDYDDEITNEQTMLENLQQAYINLEYWEEALQIEQYKCQYYLKSNTDEYADSIHAQGKFFLRQSNFNNSKILYEEALEYFTTNQNFVQLGHVLISLAGWHFFKKELEQALEYLHRAEDLLDSNPSLLVKCLDNQGLIYRLRGEYEVALDKYQQALQVVVVPQTEWALQMHVADMHVALEESHKALAVYQELLQNLTNDSHHQQQLDEQAIGMQGVLLHNIATIHVEQGEYEMALEEFNQALHIKQSVGGEHNPEVAKTLNSLGALHAGVFDEKPLALEYFQRVLIISRMHADGNPQTDPDVMNAIRNIATMEEELQKDKMKES